jgi:beta-glucanase (GH16 family)
MLRQLVCCLLAAKAVAADQLPGWKLVWNDEFNALKIDSNKWSPCKRGTSDWNNTMTRDPRCFKIGGGTLRLIGIVNPDTTKDPSPFLTGGITSKDKFSFQHGKIVIRARFQSAKGAWPALWMLGTKGRWPHNGEIDLMEHLNFDDKVYQTIHSGFTHSPEAKTGPPKSTTAPIARDDWNTYGAEWDAEKIVFTVNGRPTLTYPKVPEKGAAQWPFDQPFYLIFSMQIGGKWVGETDPADYPTHLEIDWVRVYRKPEGRRESLR